MSIFYTSDLHIGHEKVARIRGEDLALDPDDVDMFITVHDGILAENWDAVVDDEDIVYVLGDISSGSSRGQLGALTWLKSRPGTKHLILGNHDGPHPMYRDSHKWMPIYLQEAFTTVQLAARRRIALAEGHTSVLLSHFPYSGDHSVNDRHTQWRLRDEGMTLLHGHVHSRDKLSSSRYLASLGPFTEAGIHYVSVTPRPANNQIHVGVDAWGLAPVSHEEIRQLVIAA